MPWTVSGAVEKRKDFVSGALRQRAAICVLRRGGLSRLSVWWIKLGIVPERIEISGLYRLRKNSRLSG